jgi:hypothetical protein
LACFPNDENALRDALAAAARQHQFARRPVNQLGQSQILNVYFARSSTTTGLGPS